MVLTERAQAISVVESNLQEELKRIRKVIKKPALKYTEWNGEEVSAFLTR